MRVQREKGPSDVVKLTVTADESELQSIKKHILGHFVRRVKVPGFRAGKAPLSLVEQYIDQQALTNEFMEHALNDLYGKAINQEKIRPIAPPQVAVKKFVPYSQLEFTAEVDALGKITLADYKNIKLAKPKVSITAQNVNGVIANLRQRLAERKVVERPAKKGDEIVIDFSGKDEKGGPVPGADGKDYPLILGSDTFIPGFEANIIGLKTSEDKDFTLTFPKDYGVSALRGKKVTFSVHVQKVHQLVEPKLDDSFAAKAGPFKTLAELKADIKQRLVSEQQNQTETQFQNELVAQITQKSRLDVPPRLVDEQIMRAEEEEKRNLTYQGQTWQEHLKAEGVTEQEHRDRQRPDAELRVKAGLVLSEIAEKENIQVSPEELEIRLQLLKSQYQDPQMQAELDKPENRRDIAARLLTEKTIAKLVEYASR